MASVTPRRNKDNVITSWRVQKRLNGHMMQETFAADRHEEAQTFGTWVDKYGWENAAHRLDKLSNRVVKVDTPTLAEFTQKYLDPESGILTGVQPGTRKDYHGMAKWFLPMLGELPVDVIDKDDIGQWVAWVEKQPSPKFKGQLIAAKTVKNYHALLSNIFRIIVEKGYRRDNPAYRTRLSEGTPREPVFLSRAEFAAVYNEIPDYYKPLVAFLVGSQARWSEATALNGRDLNRDTVPPTVRINKAWKKNPDGPPIIGVTKTKRGRRTVSLWDELVELIGTPDSPDDYLFRGKNRVYKGKPTEGRIWYGMFNDRVWHPAVKRSGITSKPNPHDLRHTGASWLIADGKPLPYIQARLGHESYQTTVNIYGHLLPDAHTEMSASLQSTMSNVLPIKEISPRELGSKISDSTDTDDDA